MKILELKNNESYEITDKEASSVVQAMMNKTPVLIKRLEVAIDPKMIARVYTPKTYLGTEMYQNNIARYCIRRKFRGDGYTLLKHWSCGWSNELDGTIEELKAYMEKNNMVPIDDFIASSVKGNNTLDIPVANRFQLKEGNNEFNN